MNLGLAPEKVLVDACEKVADILMDCRRSGKNLLKIEDYKKTREYALIKDRFLYSDIDLDKMFNSRSVFTTAFKSEWLNEIGTDLFRDPIDKRHIDPNLKSACDSLHLEVNVKFKKQLENFNYLLQIHDFLLIHGPELCGKASLINAAAKAQGLTKYSFSTVALASSTGCSHFESFLSKLVQQQKSKRTQKKDALIVLEGPLLPKIKTFLLPILESQHVILTSGKALSLPRRLKLVVKSDNTLTETQVQDLPSRLFPVKAENSDLPWPAIVTSVFHHVFKQLQTLQVTKEEIRAHY